MNNMPYKYKGWESDHKIHLKFLRKKIICAKCRGTMSLFCWMTNKNHVTYGFYHCEKCYYINKDKECCDKRVRL